jgi:protein subunit release factor A
MKEKLFTITKKDLDIQTFKSGGKGGQHQNTTDSGVRIIHRESRAVGESRNHKSQHQNKKEALRRMTETSRFKLWVNRRAYEISSGQTIEQEVEEMMRPENIRVEVKNEAGQWEETSQ